MNRGWRCGCEWTPQGGLADKTARPAARSTGAARDYGTIPATIADAGATMFSGFYLPGDPWGGVAVAFTTAP